MLKDLIEKQVDKAKFTVMFESLSETEQPLIITQPEFIRRMKDMSLLGGGMSYMGELPEHYNLVVNSNNNIISKMLLETDEAKQASIIQHLFDIARLSQNMLKGKELNEFIKRSTEMIV
jgi:molecular chaperone HtpG